MPTKVTNEGARGLEPAKRQEIAIWALAGSVPVTELAKGNNVSRKFVYQQQEKEHQ